MKLQEAPEVIRVAKLTQECLAPILVTDVEVGEHITRWDRAHRAHIYR